MKLLTGAALLASILELSSAVSTFSPARPPAIPLAVRSPYLNTWLDAGPDGGNGGYLAGQWPQFWANQITAWTGMIRVDGHIYTWMGQPGPDPVTQTAFQYTSTRSVFTMNVGGMVSMNIAFLSPVTPNDLKRQSLPFSYLDVQVASMDGAGHAVSLYADISAEWISGDRNAIAQWDYGITGATGASASGPTTMTTMASSASAADVTDVVEVTDSSGKKTKTTKTKKGSITSASNTSSSQTPTDVAGGIAYHRVYRQTQLAFSETSDQTDYGYWYWATKNTANLTYQSGQDTNVRSNFATNGKLPNTKDTNYRAIQNAYPVFGFAVDLGVVGTKPVDTLFTIGLAQQQAIQFDGANGIVSLPSLWTSYYPSDLAALSFFYNDYATSESNFDGQLKADAVAAGGQDYLTITSLAARQAFAATQLVGDPSKTYFFLKEISSDGNVQTVDVIFPFHPILLYSNPGLLKLLLDPLFENQEAGQYPHTYSMHDLGSHYPNATGHPLGNDEQQPLEECGNMLIMTLAYAQRKQDTAYLSQHYKILQQWTSYLIQDSLYPANQISTDDFAGSLANQTDLALKGMIGIQAMAVIANLTGHAADSANYTATAHNYITQWQNLGVAHDANPPHTTLNYGANDTHGLLYNLYADRELQTNLVPQSIYDMQSAFYPTVSNKYGVPLDTRHSYTKDDWQMFAAAVASQSTRQQAIQKLAQWINETPTNNPFTDLFDTMTGDHQNIPQFVARPVQGGTYALLALPK